MKIIKDSINDIQVTYIKTNKFKSVAGGIYFRTPIKKHKLTIRNLLRRVIIESCNKYDTNQKLNINTLENYNAYYSSSCSRFGNYIINGFKFYTINDKFINDEVIDPSVDTFCEILFNPNIMDNEFSKESFDINYKRFKAEIESEKEDTRSYCYKKLLKNMDQNKPYSYQNNIDDLQKITPNNLYNEYLDMINNSEIELVLAGDFDYKMVANKILHNLKNRTFNDVKLIENCVNDKEIIINKEIVNTSGSVICVGMKCINLTDYERLYVVPILSCVLGGGASSRMFNIIREENSLAYYCYSKYEKDDGLLNIYAGIDKNNFNKTKDLIISTIRELKSLSNAEVLRAKNEIISGLKQSEDYLLRLLDLNYYERFYNEGNGNERIQNFFKVTTKDCANVCDKIFVDSIYFVEGDK